MSLHLYSGTFRDNAPIQRKYTCDGEDLSPPLEWAGTPAGTRSFALICDDPDAPGGTFGHWAVYDMPPEVSYLEEGYSGRGRHGRFPEAANDFGANAYGGPCPPEGHGPHRYRFRLLALDVPALEAGPSPRVADVEAAAQGHVLAEAEVDGSYERVA